jgi:hypothetical protein
MFSGQKHPPGKAVVPASATACRAVGLQIRLQPQRGWLKAGLRPTRAPKSQTGGSQCARCAARDDACPLTVAASFWRPPPSRPRVWPPLSWERGIREWPVLQKLGSCEQSYTDADARSAHTHQYRALPSHQPPTHECPRALAGLVWLATVQRCVEPPALGGSTHFGRLSWRPRARDVTRPPSSSRGRRRCCA